MKKDFDLPLVNAHTHAAMIAFRGMAEDLLLKDWLEKYIWPMEKEKVNPKFVYENTNREERHINTQHYIFTIYFISRFLH